MKRIIPFKGILYNTSKVSMEDVLAPPYDIITPEYREALYMQSPYNIVRIDFGKELPEDNETENKYKRARNYLEKWLKENIFIQSDNPSFYIYEMDFSIDGKIKKLAGLIGLVKLEELGKGNIYPHECTHSKPKQDRLNLMRSCEANTSPIFSLYKSMKNGISEIIKKTTEDKPYINAIDIKGDTHKLWIIDNPEEIRIIQDELENKPIFIADGHHRYETAFEFYREISGKNPSSELNSGYVMMFLANMCDEGVTILPTHRLLKEIPPEMENLLSEHFNFEVVKNDFDIVKRLGQRKNSFGFVINSEKQWYILSYKGGRIAGIPENLQDIDVMILHELIFKELLHTADIGYEMNVDLALDKLKLGQYKAAFFLNPTKVEDVEKSALSSVRMPPKSTYFYPKLLTGLVINKFGSSTN
ncbi:MAG: DUF1015 domain-containing protein [Nitrospirae bacterium]|jgi:uncharacterized protein (DUF1015 family)|nr:DUF1015 domain-containing protein [Nitrospirota bacterium]